METPDVSPPSNPPGKLRTWWHPLLVRLLEWLLRDSCEIQDEVTVGRMPLRLDILLIRRLEVELPEAALRDLSAISRRLNAYTLLEFKSPTDTLERGDWNKLMGCAHLFVAQSAAGIPAEELTLLILAPRLTEGFRDELRQSQRGLIEEESGIHRIEGGAFRAYVVETDRVAGLGEPALTLFSREFVQHPRQFAESLKIDHAEMLYYIRQQIERFRQQMPDFEVHHMTENMNQTLAELQASFLNSLPVEERLKGVSTEEVLKRYSAEEVLKRYSVEEMLHVLGEEERARMRRLLNNPPNSP